MGWLSLLPPIIAISVVLWRKEVLLALILAIFASEALQQANIITDLPIAGLDMMDRIVGTLTDLDNARLLTFALMIGALLAFMYRSGGVAAVVNIIVSRGWVKSGRQASLTSAIIGVIVFVESNLSVLTAGLVSRGLFDRYGVSRTKLAYFIDSTSAPVCILVLLNGWGAFVLALLNAYEFEVSAAEVLWGSVIFNFYAIVTLIVVFYSAATGRFFGPLATAENPDTSGLEENEVQEEQFEATRARFMIVPLFVMIFSMIGFMLWTGGGDMAAGSGSRSILYATALGCLTGYLLLITDGNFSHKHIVEIGIKGMNELLPITLLLLLSIALGGSLKGLGTGQFIAGVVGGNLHPLLLAPLLFVAGGLISFFTGTSWGTFAILIPLAMPLVGVFDLPPAFLLAAILGGGVFGDHCSPISDTTLVSSLAAGCELLDHVRTQLPYALAVGGVTIVLYLVTGLFLI
ncbi:Na+/H+ antiporter NhaC family protein [Kordiimonas aestuarii]|uniref:Na+/H+ antiporter NhaC family protein n=1 Tax=Kordiimonas aestuarii TaxID=1005925 RepID=UPI0021CE7F0B|nr:Na+/H+ antiporter NhaC family protein [Kordiimonas aestuarii]